METVCHKVCHEVCIEASPPESAIERGIPERRAVQDEDFYITITNHIYW